jgi:hypothetical protein
MQVAVACDLVAMLGNCRDYVRVTLGRHAQNEESGRRAELT